MYNAALEQTLFDLNEIIKETKEEKSANPKNKELLTVYGKRKLLLSLNWTKPQKELKVRMFTAAFSLEIAVQVVRGRVKWAWSHASTSLIE